MADGGINKSAPLAAVDSSALSRALTYYRSHRFWHSQHQFQLGTTASSEAPTYRSRLVSLVSHSSTTEPPFSRTEAVAGPRYSPCTSGTGRREPALAQNSTPSRATSDPAPQRGSGLQVFCARGPRHDFSSMRWMKTILRGRGRRGGLGMDSAIGYLCSFKWA